MNEVIQATATPVPQVTAANVRWFVAMLKKAGRWTKREELGLEERRARRFSAVARPLIISFPGSKGYLHADHVRREELEHCINAFRAIAKDATCTANLYQHLYNQKFGGVSSREVQDALALDA